jgi:hypothetical protein
MPFSRRRLMKWAASMSAFTWAGLKTGPSTASAFAGDGLQAVLWMAKLCPKYTGNQAHATFIEFLATQLQAHGLDVARKRYTLPRWDAKRWEIAIAPASGSPFKAPVTSYFPYSGHTSASAAVTVEHLGCQEWMDVAVANTLEYRATGKHEWSVAITPSKPTAGLLVESLQGSLDRAGVVNPVNGGFLGEGNSLSRAGIPTIGYIPQPNYLLAGPAGGCIEKLSADLMYSQIQVFARLIHGIDAMSASQLKKS